ncbi:DUF2625 family protein [Cellulomonas xiejunii]|uniref:DUF2625 family protein n=1 Tax=Cellulomonas xiejunii TaxID=2968083 RepID=UPI001D0DD3E7|nr:DUF2625 family protein [Cellulomonas xiejunii]MCC2316091.1 DUF2625 domain-containing protein [Cellulomonas xiejunii]
MTLRSGAELADVAEPAWPLIADAVDTAVVPVRVIRVSRDRGLRELRRLQVSAASVLGALALNCGGLVLDGGWVRILGAGAEHLPSLADANGLGDGEREAAAPGRLVVAFDVLGGVFAIDGGALGIGPGEVCYRGPDTLRWVGLGAGHGAFVMSALDGALGDDFYEGLRWSSWREDVTALQLDEGMHLWPPPFSAEGRAAETVSRRPAPHAELVAYYDDLARQLESVPEGARFNITTRE